MESKQILIIYLFVFFCWSVYSQSIQSKPNVLFIICDDLNDYQGVFGGHPQVLTLKTLAPNETYNIGWTLALNNN